MNKIDYFSTLIRAFAFLFLFGVFSPQTVAQVHKVKNAHPPSMVLGSEDQTEDVAQSIRIPGEIHGKLTGIKVISNHDAKKRTLRIYDGAEPTGAPIYTQLISEIKSGYNVIELDHPFFVAPNSYLSFAINNVSLKATNSNTYPLGKGWIISQDQPKVEFDEIDVHFEIFLMVDTEDQPQKYKGKTR